VTAGLDIAVASSDARALNEPIAGLLREMAGLLETQGGNPFRSRAYRHAADTVSAWPEAVRAVFEREGLAGLDALPGVGAGIAAAIAEMLACGHWSKLDRLRGEVDAEALFRTVPGVGPELARQFHDDLGVDTLEALETAAHDGRLARMPRLGARRAAAIRAALTEMLDRRRVMRRGSRAAVAAHQPPVDLLLDVDREYREGAAADRLPKIAPKRFNPDGVAWLPVLHAHRGDWHVTALFSNTARAHDLGRTRDWVVLYAEDAEHAERQYTVVTAPGGPLAGRRVVRGREIECQAWYDARG
jgi:hypothetical protein